MKAPLLGTLSGRHVLCPSLHRDGDPKTAFFSGLYAYPTQMVQVKDTEIDDERRTWGEGGGGRDMSYLHLLKKLSMLLFFLRAGKSRSYTSASRPSCRQRRRVNMQANKATAAYTAQYTHTHPEERLSASVRHSWITLICIVLFVWLSMTCFFESFQRN